MLPTASPFNAPSFFNGPSSRNSSLPKRSLTAGQSSPDLPPFSVSPFWSSYTRVISPAVFPPSTVDRRLEFPPGVQFGPRSSPSLQLPPSRNLFLDTAALLSAEEPRRIPPFPLGELPPDALGRQRPPRAFLENHPTTFVSFFCLLLLSCLPSPGHILSSQGTMNSLCSPNEPNLPLCHLCTFFNLSIPPRILGVRFPSGSPAILQRTSTSIFKQNRLAF